MKKFLTFIVGTVVGLGAYAQDFDSGDLIYSVLSPDDKTCAVTGMTVENKSSITSLTIPPTVFYEGEEYTVTEIGDYSCQGLNNMVELNLPETLKKIGLESFAGCNRLPRLIIPDSVTFIHGWAFEYSYSLKYVELGKSVEDVYNHPFYGAPLLAVNLKAETPFRFEGNFGFTYEDYFPTNPLIGVPDNSVDIYKQTWSNARIYAYQPANSISFDQETFSVNPGESVQLEYTVDPENAPVGFTCPTVGVTISNDGLVTVSPFAENFSTDITAGTLNGLTANCYLNVAPLPRINVDGLEYMVCSGENKEVILSGVYDMPANLVIPETVEYDGETYAVAYIKDYIIRWNDTLEELTIPATVKSIGNYSFQSCYNLSKVTIADSNEPLELGADIFNSCNNLSTFYLGRNITGNILNTYGSDIKRVILGTCVTEVPNGTFAWWGSTISVVESYNPVPPTLLGECFSYNREQIKVIVPEEYVEAYQEAWGEWFGSIGEAKDVTELAFEQDEFSIYAGEVIKLPLIVAPEDAAIMWSSSNKYIVNVDREGYVWVNDWNASGEAMITATALNGLSAECRVIVKKWFSIPQNNILLSMGESQQLEIEKSDRFAALDVPATWGIDYGDNVITIDPETGVITAIAYGNARVYAMAYIEELGNTVYAYADVRVVELPTSVTPDYQEITATRGETVRVDLTVEPNDEFVDKTIFWTNNNPDIAEIYQGWDGAYYVSCYNAGVAYIYGQTLNGLTVEIKVNVLGQIESLIFNTEHIYVAPQGTFQLEYTTVPENTGQSIRFESGNEAVATVDSETGLVTGVDFGNTYISAYAENGWSWSVPVQVCIMPESVNFDGSSDYEGQLTSWTYFQLEFTPDDPNVCKHIDWTADDPSIVNIDSNDNSFIGRNFGTTAFRGVAVNGDVLEGTITINGLKILLDGEMTTWTEVNLGDEFKLDIEASSENLLENLTFTSDDPKIVTVNEDGLVTAVGCGRTNVLARTSVEVGENEWKYYDTYIYITVDPTEGIAFNTNKLSLAPGNWGYISILRAQNVDWSNITWETSDENVVAISWSNHNEAQLSYMGPGEATVTATDEYGNVATCEVSCYGIVITPAEVEMYTNSTFQLEVQVLPETANIEPITWSSQDPEFVSVDENGLISTNDIIGLTRIYAYTRINGYYVESACDVRVYEYVPVTEITLNETSISAVEGEEIQLIATINPENATNKDILWTSSNDEVATVDESGLVKLLSAGHATITATAHDGIAATCDVTVEVYVPVYVPVTSITLNETSISAVEGEEIQLIATINPENATNQELYWLSSNRSVATVDENGLVTIHSVGNATITVFAVENMSVRATCTISGTSGVEGILSDGAEFDIYNVNGILIKKAATAEDYKQLERGIYLIKTGDKVIKVQH